MSEWKETTLGEIATASSGGTPASQRKEFYHNGSIPWLNTKEINFNRLYGTERKITPLGLENSAAKWIPANTVIVAMYGATAGRSAIAKIPLTTNQACCNLVVESSVADYEFVYYQLVLNYPKLAALANGGAQQNLNSQIIKGFPIPLPPLPTQRRIAAVLSALDDKIELNNRINANLEAQAQALFRSWFVDFEPWGGTMPEGWREGSLLDIADYCNGLAMQKYRPAEGENGLPVLKIRELRQGYCDEESEQCTRDLDAKYLVNDGDVIFSWSGSLLVDVWCGGEAGLNQHLFKVTSEQYPKWFYLWWTKYHLAEFSAIAANMATTMGHIKRGELEKAKVFIPDTSSMKQLSKTMAPLLNSAINRRLENRTLAALRDALLPKLMSGEIDVDNVEIPA